MALLPHERLKGLRLALGYTRDEFCELTGIRPAILENCERGHQRINQDTLELIGKQWPEYVPFLVLGEIEWTPTKGQRQRLKLLAERLSDEH
jgi:transcriptional regulator with XRE-family HTH domain